jgi:hypothetical protein
MKPDPDAYRRAQLAMAELKACVLQLISDAPPPGLRNADIGRALGIYGGHKGHEGHVSRTILEILASEGLITQNASKRWQINQSKTTGE